VKATNQRTNKEGEQLHKRQFGGFSGRFKLKRFIVPTPATPLRRAKFSVLLGKLPLRPRRPIAIQLIT
jgi:hypothetical protein